jgi:transposase
MSPADLLLPNRGLTVTAVTATAELIAIAVNPSSPSAPCPVCGHRSDRVHARYRRTLADLAAGSRRVVLVVTARKFRCTHPGCDRRLFCERLTGVADPNARTTTRLTDLHRLLGFALGGEPGARVAGELGVPTSGDTLLRRVTTAPDGPEPVYRFVGIDDFALRKGRVYGTILIDLERGRVIDLLPGRDGTAVEAWLKAHPGVEVITRDRWAAYANAATAGAPQATQVADRFHLLTNLREAVERVIARVHPLIRAEVAATSSVPVPVPVLAPVPPLRPPSAGEQARQAKRHARTARRERVRALRREGYSVRAIARHLRMSPKTVIECLRNGDDDRPHGNRGRRGPSGVDVFRADVEAWVAAGGTNTAELYRQLRAKGCPARYDAVRRFANRLLGSSGRPGRRSPADPRPTPAPGTPSPRALSFQFACPKAVTDDEPSLLERVRSAIPDLDTALTLAGEFARMVRKTVIKPLAEWMAAAVASGVPELVGFAHGLHSDAAAVQAALTSRWSNGAVEGQVNRLKAIKRAMYGRAGIKLLCARVRHQR